MHEERGKLIPDYENCTEHVITGCFIDFTTSSVDNEGRVQTQLDTTLYAPVDTVLERYDLIKAHGITYQLDSHPFERKGPTNRLDHLQVRLRLQEG
jgi:hypothetical protein